MSDDGGHAPARWIGAIAATRDREAFAALFGFYAPRIKAMLMRAGVAAEAAEDLAQETLLVIWRKAAQFDSRRASAAAWIFTIARNLRIDRLRRDKRAKLFALYETIEPKSRNAPMRRSMQASATSACVRRLPNCPKNKSASFSFHSSKAVPTAISQICSICRWGL